MSRDADFKRICAGFGPHVEYVSEAALVIQGDSLKALPKIPDHSVSLVLTDPPYHSTKKRNIANDTAFEEDDDFLRWMAEFFRQWKRVLRPNGSLFLFCSSRMAAKLEIQLSSEFNVLSQIVWTKPNDPGYDGWKQKMKKEALRQWYAHSERVIFAEPASEGNLRRSYFANFLRRERTRAGITAHYLAEVTRSYGKVNHGGTVSNWETGRNIPNRSQYKRLCEALLQTGTVNEMPAYEDVIRPFAVDSSREFTDVWTFRSVRPYAGKHPAEKPLDLLRHAVTATTFPGDIVLDCFGGSGSTAYACVSTGRRTVTIELESKWAKTIARRLQHLDGAEHPADLHNAMLKNLESQPLLFSATK